MASGTSSPAAEEVLRTTKEKANFQRLTWLLMRGGLALLREVFDSIHPLGSLSAVLGANKVHLKNLTRRAEVPLRPTRTRNLWKVGRV